MKLSSVFKKISQQLDVEFGELSKEISHPADSGKARENALRNLLKNYLPKRIAIDTGYIIDAQGNISRQIDIVIYDSMVATIYDVNGIKYFPCEIVIAVGQVKSDINSRERLSAALLNIESVKKLDRSNQGKSEIITGPGISLKGVKFDPSTEHRDQILGFVFTRTSMTRQTILEELQKYNGKLNRQLWLNVFCAYKDFLISYESDKGLTPSAMDAKNMYCTVETETPNLLLLFLSILANFVNIAHIARPNYFSYAEILTTSHTDHPLTTNI